LFADYAPGRKVLQQRLVDFSRSVLLSCTDSIYPHSSLERIQALTLFSIYQWVSLILALRELQLLMLIPREERSEFGRKLVYHDPRNSDGTNTYSTLTSSCQALHAESRSSVSLNRDGTTTWRMQPLEAEVRRRLWCMNLSLIIIMSIWLLLGTLFSIDR